MTWFLPKLQSIRLFTTPFGSKSGPSRSLVSMQSKPKVRIIKSRSNNIFVNIAIEEWLLEHSPLEAPLLYLWQNGPAVVIGKHQNPWKECNVQLMHEDNVSMSRRYSGGGAVYQDLGNSVFTFLAPTNMHSIDDNFDILKNALATFGINAERSGRNDMTFNGKKISGSAFRQIEGRSIHHGTVLLDLNKDHLTRYLVVNKAKLQSKGVDSVRQRITNLKEYVDIDHERLCDSLITQFCKFHASHLPQQGQLTDSNCDGAADPACTDQDTIQIETIDQDILSHNLIVQNIYDQLTNWDWLFGKTPQFENNFETRFTWGLIDLYLDIHKGKITQVKLYSDSLFPIMVETVEKHLAGAMYDMKGIETAMESAKVKLTDLGIDPVVLEHVDQMKHWLIHQL